MWVCICDIKIARSVIDVSSACLKCLTHYTASASAAHPLVIELIVINEGS